MKEFKQVLMIHDMKEEYFKSDLSKYVLTFDDCLYSVYKYRIELSKINTQKYIAVPTGRILSTRTNLLDNVDCITANNMWLLQNDNSAYMTVNELLEMKELEFVLCGHSHYHARGINSSSKLDTSNLHYIKEDTDKMLDWFRTNIKITPTAYAYPYNKENNLLTLYLKHCGFDLFFGKERILIEKGV